MKKFSLCLIAAGLSVLLLFSCIFPGNGDNDNDNDTDDDTSEFVAVTGIDGVPGTLLIGIPKTLSGEVQPANATNSTITWSVKTAGDTGAVITDGSLEAENEGTITVTATIANGKSASADFTKDFEITVYDGREFWAQNMVNEKFYKVEAVLSAENDYCQVWVEIGADVNKETAEEIAKVYEEKVYTDLVETFGLDKFESADGEVNIMDLATSEIYNADDVGKLRILLLDIQDGYDGKGGYVDGYFWSGNYTSQDTWDNYDPDIKSNEIGMIYIDTNPGIPGSDESNMTLAHESQHLMNYIVRSEIAFMWDDDIYLMDTWIDEGLSSAAEWIFAGEHGDKWKWYNDNVGLISEGNTFFVWGNRENEDPEAILADYSTVYLFFQWLRVV